MPQLRSRTYPLTEKEKEKWFKDHLPYLRVQLTNHIRMENNPELLQGIAEEEKYRVRVCTYEAGVVTCRKFIEFMGIGIKYNPYRLVKSRGYYSAPEDNNSYEVKIVDLGGKWVELSDLTSDEQDLLQRMYLTGHRATAHLTDSSPYQGEWKIFNDAVLLVDRLLKEYLYDVVGIKPSIA